MTMQIFHIIGLVGAGKTTFIKKFLSNYFMFDVQSIYKATGFVPEDLRNSKAYRQFADALKSYVDSFIICHQKSNARAIIVESSGANRVLNEVLKQYRMSVFVVWICPNIISSHKPEFWKARPYGKSLNKHILKLFSQKKLPWIHAKYNPSDNSFMPELSENIRDFFIKTKEKKNEQFDNNPWNQYYNSETEKFICPGCDATFSKRAFIQKHKERSPGHFDF
jgi:GTPase SAR1 family protein